MNKLKEVDPDVPHDTGSGFRARTTDAIHVSLGVFVGVQSGAGSGIERQLA